MKTEARNASDKPAVALFIPLKSAHYDAFARGRKSCEYRVFGPRWNLETCRVGRPVVLSRGYGKSDRLDGFIKSVTVRSLGTLAYELKKEEFCLMAEIAGNLTAEIICIGITVARKGGAA